MDFDQDTIKKYAWHLKVVGAYVQQPNPSIVGLDEKTVIGSNDAASLYPISGAHQNLGYDTIRDRIYDDVIVKRILGLIEKTFEMKESNPNIVDQAVVGFKNAIGSSLKEYFKRGLGKGINKKEAQEFTTTFYPFILKRLLTYPGKLEDIFCPINDETYILLKSCLYPLLETVFWLSPQNRGYNQTAVEYVFFNEDYNKNKREYYIFKEINSTKTTFKRMQFEEGKEWFQTRIISPYGVLFDLHDRNLAYDVDLTITSLKERSEYKNQMLVLEAILSRWEYLSNDMQNWFCKTEEQETLTEAQADQILTAISDPEERQKRINSLSSVKLEYTMDPKAFIALRISQLNVVQLGIKVSMNSGYGIFAMPTWVYSNSLIGNSFTCSGKIFGIKLFQKVSVNILENIKN